MRETLNDWVLRPISKGLQIFIIIIDPKKSIHNYVLSWNKSLTGAFSTSKEDSGRSRFSQALHVVKMQIS